MQLPLSSVLAELIVLERAGSTNDELLARAGEAVEFTVVVTTDQSAGRGRLGRTWVAPPGETLAASVLLRPRLPGGAPLPLESYGWLPLLAGLAMTRSVAAVIGTGSASMKWPNDVLIDGLKTGGLLAELAPAGAGLVIGSGVNLSIAAERLPTPNSTSLGLHAPSATGVELVDRLLSGYLVELRRGYALFLDAAGDANASELRDEVVRACSSLGRSVRVDLPDGSALHGEAIDIDASGRLVVRGSRDHATQAVAAGDVTHLRYE